MSAPQCIGAIREGFECLELAVCKPWRFVCLSNDAVATSDLKLMEPPLNREFSRCDKTFLPLPSIREAKDLPRQRG